MTGPRPPIRSACFQPDNYTNLALFADREELVEDLTDTLESFLAPGSPGEGRVLVRGHRGVGKSILTREAVRRVVETLGPMTVTVDAARTAHGPQAFMRRLAIDLARAITENVTDRTLASCAEVLRRFADNSKVTVRETQQWTRTLQLGASAKYKFLDMVQFEFGLTRVAGKSRTVEDSYERVVDDELLRGLIQELLHDCRQAQQYVLLFLDNLDQVGYGEIEEDVKRVTNLARHVFSFQDAVIVANLRSEFVSADLRKLYSHEITVEGMGPEDLLKVVGKRMECAAEDRRKALEAAGFLEVARQLTQWTKNAWGLLNWLAFLDYERLDFGPGDEAGLRKALLRFAETHYNGVRVPEIQQIGAIYKGDATKFLTASELDTHGITRELLERAMRYGVLVPDWLLSPDRYMLVPGLHFLAG